MAHTSHNKMADAPMTALILSMSLPAMFSMLIQALYNIVDSYFVAKLGENALTAVSLAFPVQNLMIALAVGTAVGINSLVSRRLGEGKQEEADHAATHGALLGVLNWVIIAVLGVLFTRLFFEAFTKTPEVLSMGCSYVYIVTIFSFGMFIQVNMEKTLQATGNMVLPMFSQLIGAVTNIILDPIMIFGLFGFPKLGVAGAAIATVIGQILGMVFVSAMALGKNHAVTISLKGFQFRKKTVHDIYAVGFPAIIMQSIGSVMVTGINAIIIRFTETAVAFFGVYFKLQSFIFMPVFGLTQGVMPIMGYNYGARNRHRLISALRIGSIIAVVIMALGTLLFQLVPDRLLGIFDATPQMLAIGVPALRLISICFIPAALGIMFSTLFQAVGKGTQSLAISLLRQLVLIMPLAFILSRFGLLYTWFAFPLAELIALVLSCCLMVNLYRKHIRTLDLPGDEAQPAPEAFSE